MSTMITAPPPAASRAAAEDTISGNSAPSRWTDAAWRRARAAWREGLLAEMDAFNRFEQAQLDRKPPEVIEALKAQYEAAVAHLTPIEQSIQDTRAASMEGIRLKAEMIVEYGGHPDPAFAVSLDEALTQSLLLDLVGQKQVPVRIEVAA